MADELTPGRLSGYWQGLLPGAIDSPFMVALGAGALVYGLIQLSVAGHVYRESKLRQIRSPAAACAAVFTFGILLTIVVGNVWPILILQAVALLAYHLLRNDS